LNDERERDVHPPGALPALEAAAVPVRLVFPDMRPTVRVQEKGEEGEEEANEKEDWELAS
jgi:hypothetical protein